MTLRWQTLESMSCSQVRRQAAAEGLRFRLGPFVLRLTTTIGFLSEQLRQLYPLAEVAPPGCAEPTTFHVAMKRSPGLRRWVKPNVHFVTDQEAPFNPFPVTHALPMLEWGVNWCIATQAHEYLQLHAAVVEKDGLALVMPAEPGSGKSTLCAALAHRGWRLLSDEFGLTRPGSASLEITPIPRPIPLKNRSIEVFRRFAPEATIGPAFPGTRKGDVAHVMPPLDSQRRWAEPATPAFVVFPRYSPGTPTRLTPMPKSQAFVELSGNSFNYRLQGERGFSTLMRLVRQCTTYSLKFDNLEHAVEVLDTLDARQDAVKPPSGSSKSGEDPFAQETS